MVAQRRVVECDFEQGVLVGGEVDRFEGGGFEQSIAVFVLVEREVFFLQIGEITKDGAARDLELFGHLVDRIASPPTQ